MLGGVFAVYIDIPTKSRYNIAWLNEQAAKRNAVKIRSSPRCREEAAFLSQALRRVTGGLCLGEGRQSAEHIPELCSDSKPEDLPLELSKYYIYRRSKT